MKTVAAFVSALLCSTAALAFKPDHQHIAKSLQKRYNGQATYYLVGLGACGIYSKPTDFIVAQNSAQYGGGYPGPNCFKSIRISAGGKSTTAQIVDECPTCAEGSLDMSQSLFEFFNPTSVGEFPITWEYTDGSGGGDDTPKETPTPKPEPKPTTHHTTSTPPPPPPPPTTTKHTTTAKPTTYTTPTTTKKVTTSTKKTTSTTPAPAPTTTSTTSSASATTTSSAPTGGNFEGINEAIWAMEALLTVAAGGN